MMNWDFLKRALHVSVVCAILGVLVPTVATAQPAPNLVPYKTLATDALKLVTAGDMKGAYKTLLDLEAKWDASGLDASLPDLDDEMDTMKNVVSSGDKKKSTAELNNYLQMIAEASKPAAH
jgi:hypothetical protein